MPLFSPDELSQWVFHPWQNGTPEEVIRGVSHDTRTLRSGELYIAIRGERFDGHDFVREAFDKGAVGALVEEGFRWDDNPVLKVPDTLEGLQDLARGYRSTWKVDPIGITGSVGKTTVKEMCADVLAVKGETHRTAGNFNNHIGLPLTMLALPVTARFGVFELGMNHPGEIAMLTDLLKPTAAILTDICNAHRENFQSLGEIAREKTRLAEGVPESGMAIIDRDSEWYTMMRRHMCCRVITVSLEGSADYVGRKVHDTVMNVNGFDYTMPLPGDHIMCNALRAIALGMEMGLDPMEIEAGLCTFKELPMRWQEKDVAGVGFINDAYNANPLSMRASLKTFSNLAGAGRKWAVVGGMRELGAITDEEHAALGGFIDGLALDGVIVVGDLASPISCEHIGQCYHCKDTAEAASILKDRLTAGDKVLLKASRGERLEQVLKHFEEI